MSRTPPLVWGLLVAGVLGVSFAGAILQHVNDIPPLMRASWRLQITVLMLAPFAIWQYNEMDTQSRARMFERRTVLIIFGQELLLRLISGRGLPLWTILHWLTHFCLLQVIR